MAQAASIGKVKDSDFNVWWPIEEKLEVNKKIWGSKEDYELMKSTIEKVHGIKI